MASAAGDHGQGDYDDRDGGGRGPQAEYDYDDYGGDAVGPPGGWVEGDTHHVPEGSKFEYLDHTADVQLHSWGDSLKEAFEWNAMAMFAYMTDIRTVEKLETQEIEAEGDDFASLMFHFLDELLFLFSADPFFIAREVKITEFDTENFRIKAVGLPDKWVLGRFLPHGSDVIAPGGLFLWPKKFGVERLVHGETFDLTKHPQGTEVKAITYSAMQIYDDKPTNDCYVIIDI